MKRLSVTCGPVQFLEYLVIPNPGLTMQILKVEEEDSGGLEGSGRLKITFFWAFGVGDSRVLGQNQNLLSIWSKC